MSRSGSIRVRWERLAGTWRRRLVATVAVLAVGAGCGGEDGGERPTESPDPVIVGDDPGSGPVRCPVSVGDDGWEVDGYIYEFTMIEDFEFGAGTGWYTNNAQCSKCEDLFHACADPEANPGRTCTNGSKTDQRVLDACWVRCEEIQSPPYFSKPLPAAAIPGGGRCGSTYALHMVAGPFNKVPFDFQESWGGVIGRTYSQPGVDFSAYDGIALWGRRHPGSRDTVRLDVSDTNTDQEFINPETGEPNCNPDISLDDPTDGCDKWGGFALLHQDWEFFAFPFNEMRQSGWGRPREALLLGGIMSVGFLYDVGLWDFWIDDIALYKRRPE